MFHVRRRPADSQAARRRKKKLSGSGASVGGGSTTNNLHGGGGSAGGGGAAGSGAGGTIQRLTADGHHQLSMDGDGGGGSATDHLPYLVELNPDGSQVRHGNQTRRHVISPTVTEVGSERPTPPHPHSPVSGK